MTRLNNSAPVRIWALLGAHAGDNDQVIALAEAIGLPFETKHLSYNGLRHVGPRLLGASLMSLTKASRANVTAQPPPDLTLSAGHRSVAVVRELQRRGKGRTRSIHVGFPRVSASHFDLVITTPQYPMADHPNLLRLPFALTRVATKDSDHADCQVLEKLPHPRQLLIVGGPNPFWTIDTAALRNAIDEMVQETRANGGSIIATTSPRTPEAIARQLAAALQSTTIPSLLARPGKPPRLSSMLAAADSIRVTADSVSMVSDAIWTDKPVAVVPVRQSKVGVVAMGALDLLRPGRRIYPQDLRFFWRALEEVGVTETLAKPRTSPKEVMADILGRVDRIVERLR